MHCTSCSLMIDGELEDTKGVIEAETSYAKSQVIINYDEKKVTADKLRSIIESLGYQVVSQSNPTN
ncbi:cation transporter [Patescibacteria group bacterium]|nr:cation transporter [Patescibacteria group bacterium]